MPKNKRESLIYTTMVCALMVIWMSTYNVTLHTGQIGLEALKEAWMGFPIAYAYAMLFDWFAVSGIAKKFAYRFLIEPESSNRKKIIAISCCTIVPMVIVMSLYGALEACVKSGAWNTLFLIWITNIPKNLAMAAPFQLLIAGPVIRKLFRATFPEGKILA